MDQPKNEYFQSDDVYVNKESKFDRPNWDEFFMSLVNQAVFRSACLHVPTGAVFVDDNHHIIGFGYSGPTKGDFHCREAGICLKIDGDPVTGELKRCNGAHAEMNAIVNCGDTIRLRNSTLYCTVFPCYDCMKILNNAGIKRIVFKRYYERLVDGGKGKTEGTEQEALELAHKRGIVMEKFDLLDDEKLRVAKDHKKETKKDSNITKNDSNKGEEKHAKTKRWE